MVFRESTKKKGISRVFRAIPWESIQSESKKYPTYFVGSSSAFVGLEAFAEPEVEAGAEPEGIPTAGDISLDIATKYGIK